MTESPDPRVLHETIRLEREFPVSDERVFRAYAEVDQRVGWSAPSDTAKIVYSRDEFRVGGSDEFRCGAAEDLKYEGKVHYLAIEAPGLIVYQEVISAGGHILAASLVTWEITPTAMGSRLVVTDQITSLVGLPMIEGSRIGMSAALDHLVKMVV